MDGLRPGLKLRLLIVIKTNSGRRLSRRIGSVKRIKCTLCALSVHGGRVRVLGMGVKGL